MSGPEGVLAEQQYEEHEHRELRHGIDALHDVANRAGHLAADDLSFAILGVLRWAERVLEPHARWEDSWLYPEMDQLAGSCWATKMLRYEHHQIRELVARVREDRKRLVGPPTPDELTAIRAHLFGLEALIRAHIEREERFLVPLLARDVEKVEPVALSV
jgi:hemerythrin-like domain-containing protein